MVSSTLLQVKDLTLIFKSKKGNFTALNKINFEIQKGTTLGIIGESGSGKSVTALSILGLLPHNIAEIESGNIYFEGQEITHLNEKQKNKFRGQQIAMIFQEPMTCLNPVFTIGNQIREVLQLHKKLSSSETKEQVLFLLKKVGIPNPEERFNYYPHQLSGGQRQRVMIAMALAGEPKLLICDEPTTALDVTVQKQILELLKDLQQQFDLTLLFISHDLGVIKKMADQILVMKDGKIVEQGLISEIYKHPKEEYTKALFQARFESIQSKKISSENISAFTKKSSCNLDDLLRIENLCVHYPLKSNFFQSHSTWFKAVDNISLSIANGQTLGIVGESGCGKSTLARAILRLQPITSGKIFFSGKEITSLTNSQLQPLRKKIQIVFQDPYASLNPRYKISSILTEPLKIHNLSKSREEQLEIASQYLYKVGLDNSALNKFPFQFSGGQRQRICIARALITKPDLLICDEAVSALDVSIQNQILTLLKQLQCELKLSLLFISHDLAIVKSIAHQTAVMKSGKIIEFGDSDTIYNNPQHHYTKTLIDSALVF